MTIEKLEGENYGFRDSAGLYCVLSRNMMWDIYTYMHKQNFINDCQSLFDLSDKDAIEVGNRAYDIWLDMDICGNDPEAEAMQDAYKEFVEEGE